MLQRIKEAVSGGFYATDKNLIADLCSEVFGLNPCRTCSLDLINCYNKLCKFVRDQETEIYNQKFNQIEVMAKNTYRFKKEWQGSEQVIPALGLVINEQTLNYPEVLKFVLGHDKLKERIELIDVEAKAKKTK